MKTLSFLLVALVISSTACSFSHREQTAERQQVAAAASEPQKTADRFSDTEMKPVSLNEADASQNAGETADRKIIKDADLTIEVSSPTEVQRTISSIAESRGGFVVSSEMKQTQRPDSTLRNVEVKLVARVPSNQFETTVSEIQKLALNVIAHKRSGNDVTEEFIDLDARIRTQKALETQFLEIMKQAGKIEDALEVQRQIADVRTEIEKLEGRKRFLENRSSLSTITANIKPPVIIAVNPSGFGRHLREAVSDSVDVASGIILFVTRFVIVMVPIFVLLILPIGLTTLYFVRRARRMRLAHALDVLSATE